MNHSILLFLFLFLSSLQVSAQVTELTQSNTSERNKIVSMLNGTSDDVPAPTVVELPQKVNLYIPKKPWYNPYLIIKPPVAEVPGRSTRWRWNYSYINYARRFDNFYGVPATTPQ